MPNSRTGGSEWHWVKGLLILVLVGLLESCGHSSQENANEVGPKVDALEQRVHVLDSLVQMIHQYLGNDTGAVRANWAGLTGNIKGNNEDLKAMLIQIRCDIYKLNHPGWTPASNETCPPGDGGTVPAAPPKYPP
jgi:hypothetical protein